LSLDLPKLAVVGDCAVRQTVAGSVQLYRLFSSYPKNKLLVVEGNPRDLDKEHRLPSTQYLEFVHDLWHPGRLHRIYMRMKWATLNLLARRLATLLRPFGPDAILSTTDGLLWIVANKSAEILGVPHHLICHDDWTALNSLPPPLDAAQDDIFGAIYARAASRLCVSQSMANEYERLYGCQGDVLLPTRGLGDFEPRVRLRTRTSDMPFVAAFSGSLTLDYPQTLSKLAQALALMNGRLDVYTKNDVGLIGPHANVRAAGFPPIEQLPTLLADSADVLFVAQPFSELFRRNAVIAFPSKLADYTAIGLPIMMCGPEYSSGVKWARQNPHACEVVTSADIGTLAQTLRQLDDDAAGRQSLAANALDAGEKSFAFDRAWNVLAKALSGGRARGIASLDGFHEMSCTTTLRP
jgi:hypothetical protein